MLRGFIVVLTLMMNFSRLQGNVLLGFLIKLGI